jgi:hypothetical protein
MVWIREDRNRFGVLFAFRVTRQQYPASNAKQQGSNMPPSGG